MTTGLERLAAKVSGGRESADREMAEVKRKAREAELIADVQEKALALLTGQVEAQYPVSRSQDGTPRIVTYALDDDADMGFLVDCHWNGLTIIDDTIVLEQQYPHVGPSGPHVYIRSLNTSSGEVCFFSEARGDSTTGMLPMWETTVVGGEEKIEHLRAMSAVLTVRDKYSELGKMSRPSNRKTPEFTFEQLN